MNSSIPTCIYCECTSDEAPLLAILYRGKEYHICSQHFPVLIHKPEMLAEKLPGADRIEPAEEH